MSNSSKIWFLHLQHFYKGITANFISQKDTSILKDFTSTLIFEREDIFTLEIVCLKFQNCCAVIMTVKCETI